jgi:hypothetical protein
MSLELGVTNNVCYLETVKTRILGCHVAFVVYTSLGLGNNRDK